MGRSSLRYPLRQERKQRKHGRATARAIVLQASHAPRGDVSAAQREVERAEHLKFWNDDDKESDR